MSEKKKKKKAFDIQVDLKRCKGCGICAALCPKRVLELKFPEAKCHAARIQDCIGCLMCELHCPDFAITCNPRGKQAFPEAKRRSPKKIKVKS